MKLNKYQCSMCHGIFEKGWSDEEALNELKEKFNISVEKCNIVCDTCYKKIMR